MEKVKVIEILDKKYPQFNTTSPDHIVSDALYQMCCENVDCLIVIENDKFVGILTEHDIANKVLMVQKPLTEMKVGEVMNRNVPVANATNSVEYCMQLLDRHNTKHIAIYDGFDFRGVISSYDLMQFTLSKRKATFEQKMHGNEYL